MNGRPSLKYSEYIKSPEWRAVRLRVIKARGRKCEKCSGASHLHVHHLTYVRFGNELDEDLQVLCKFCHEKEHGREIGNPVYSPHTHHNFLGLDESRKRAYKILNKENNGLYKSPDEYNRQRLKLICASLFRTEVKKILPKK